MSNKTTDTPRTDAARKGDWVHYTIAMMLEQELAAWRLLVIGEIAIEQQETLKKLVGEIGTIRLELIAAQESEAVWKTERDKADQRRLEAEADVERLNAELDSIHRLRPTRDDVKKLEDEVERLKAEVKRLKKKFKRAIEIADEFWDNQKQAVLVYHQELAGELDQLKATINPNKK